MDAVWQHTVQHKGVRYIPSWWCVLGYTTDHQGEWQALPLLHLLLLMSLFTQTVWKLLLITLLSGISWVYINITLYSIYSFWLWGSAISSSILFPEGSHIFHAERGGTWLKSFFSIRLRCLKASVFSVASYSLYILCFSHHYFISVSTGLAR